MLPWLGRQRMERHVTFDASCQYDSAAYNAQDVNKLFGLSFGFGGVHDNSARFGWRWSKSDQCIELLAYVYNEGKRNRDEQLRFPVVLQVKPGEKVWCHIEATFDHESGIPVYEFSAIAPGQRGGSKDVLRPAKLPCYGLTHGFYFGGELTASHDTTVRIDRL